MTQIELIKGDITKLNVDAIVNAANSTLLGGGGVDGAIHRAAGRDLYRECKTLNGCETGNAKITKGYKLSAKYVIHAVGPVWYYGEYNEQEKLATVYRRCLEIAIENNIKTIAFPNISTGVYGFPKKLAAQIVIKTVKEFIETNSFIEKIIFVAFEDDNFEIYNELLK